MAGQRAREQAPVVPNGRHASDAIELRPLRLSGVVVRKADLVDALRPYVPAVVDVQVTDDGEHFWLLLGEDQGEGSVPR